MKCDRCDVWQIHDCARATLVCPECGECQIYQEWNDVSDTSTRMMTNKSRFMYSRILHFRMWLDRAQGLDHIPAGTVRRIRRYIEQLPVERVSATRMRRVLKEVQATAYSNSLPALYKILYNEEPTQLSPSERLQAESLFLEIEECFEHNIKGHHPRKNLLSYSFLLDRILEELGLSERFNTLKTLKDAERKQESMEVWLLLMEDLNLKK